MTADDANYCDVLPDGTLGPPIDWSDGEAIARLTVERLSPESLERFIDRMLDHLESLGPLSEELLVAKQEFEATRRY